MQLEHALAVASASDGSLGNFFAHLFDSDFVARGECVSWRPEVVWLHVISDATIALAYYSIPIALIYYVRRRKDQAFNWMFVMFALFILACGTTHLMSIVAFWKPLYRLDGVIKLITGGLSIATAATLWPLIPKALAVPRPSELAEANRELNREIEERRRIETELRQAREELEIRVDERTAELRRANESLRAEMIERQRAESTLTQSEERFRVALGTAPISVFNQDRELRYTWFDGPQTGMRNDKKVVGRTDEDLFAPETALRLGEIKRRVLETGSGEHTEIPVKGDEGVRHVDFRVEPLRTSSGEIVGLTGVKVDITERKLAEQHRSFLLAELDHRVKNNLSVVLALAEESIRSASSIGEFSSAFIGRVRALAKTHAALAASRWEGVRLNDLVALTLESYVLGGPAGAPARAGVVGPRIQLSPKAASALCMTVNELVTNAAKYGAFSVPEGRVDVRWEITSDGAVGNAERILRLVWEESGGPPVAAPRRRGLGTQLIEDGVAYELGGMVRMEFRPTGVRCTVMFPLNDQNTRRGRFEREAAPGPREGGAA